MICVQTFKRNKIFGERNTNYKFTQFYKKHFSLVSFNLKYMYQFVWKSTAIFFYIMQPYAININMIVKEKYML